MTAEGGEVLAAELLTFSSKWSLPCGNPPQVSILGTNYQKTIQETTEEEKFLGEKYLVLKSLRTF